MADNLQSGMAQPELVPNMVIVLEALDPTTGANNTAVVISDVVISGLPSDGGDADAIKPLPPLFVSGVGTSTV